MPQTESFQEGLTKHGLVFLLSEMISITYLMSVRTNNSGLSFINLD